MSTTLLILALVVAAALAFDYINGFHDAANAVATVVSTGVLPLRTAQAAGASVSARLTTIFCGKSGLLLM